jgi:hypothetical protein
MYLYIAPNIVILWRATFIFTIAKLQHFTLASLFLLSCFLCHALQHAFWSIPFVFALFSCDLFSKYFLVNV